MPPKPETHVWLLRHGASTFNLQHRCQGCSDEPELTAQGREEARLSAERVVSEGIRTVIASPLRRAIDTAGELMQVLRAQDCAMTLETDARLREIELYNWEGLPFKEIRHCFPEQYSKWRLLPDSFQMQLADNELRFPVRDLFDRSRSFWDHLLTPHFVKSILLVTHGGTIRALIATALGLGPEHFQSFQQSNCGLTLLRFPSGSRRANLYLLNDTAHLGERLPKLKEGRRGKRLLFIPVTEGYPAAIRDPVAALQGIVIERVITIGSTARDLASQLFSSIGASFVVVSEATANNAVDQLLQRHSGDQLRHLAILGPPEILRRILQEQLRISDLAAESLDLRPLEITAVHRPAKGVPPVLQSLNMSKPSPALLECRL